VGDILIASRDTHAIEDLKKKLAKVFTIKDLGDMKYCLGIEVSCNREGIHLSQTSYIHDVLSKFGMTNCKPVQSPMETGLKLHNILDDIVMNDPKVPYRKLLDSLMYIAQGTRPNIAHAVSALSQWSLCYKKIHRACAKRYSDTLKEP